MVYGVVGRTHKARRASAKHLCEFGPTSKYYMLNDSFIAVYNKKEKTINIGNPILRSMPCIDIHLEADLDTGVEYMLLSSVSHFQECNITNDMPHGLNGTIFMLRAALKFAHSIWPQCKKLSMTDDSGFTDAATGVHVNLADRNMFKYGKTWYQSIVPELNLKPCSKYRSIVASILEVVDKVPKSKDRLFLGMDNKESVNTFITSKNDDISEQNKRILKVMACYGIPSLFGSEWTGRISHSTFANLDINIKRIEKPKNLKAQWGGISDAIDFANLPRQIYE